MDISKLDKNSIYIGTDVYIAKSRLDLKKIEDSLTFHYNDKILRAFKVIGDFCVVPRRFFSLSTLNKRGKVVDLRPQKYKTINVDSKIVLRKDQEEAFSRLHNSEEGVLVLPCGRGKTVIMLHEIAARKVPTLIIANTSQIMEQWRERISQFLTIDDIGVIKRDQLDWEKPIVLASVQTLYRRQLSEEIKRFFGLVVWDEVDEMSTRVYGETANLFYGNRVGLTATPFRRDGNDRLITYHIGPHIYEDFSFSSIPTVYFVDTGVDLANTYQRYDGIYRLAKVMTKLSDHEIRNSLIVTLIRKKLNEGRKIIVLGDRKRQLNRLRNLFDNAGLCTGDIEANERLEVLKTCNPIFGTRQLAKRGLDKVELDTLILLFPTSWEGSIRQYFGRILRECSGKKPPEVFILEDRKIDISYYISRAMKAAIQSFGKFNVIDIDYTDI